VLQSCLAAEPASQQQPPGRCAAACAVRLIFHTDTSMFCALHRCQDVTGFVWAASKRVGAQTVLEVAAGVAMSYAWRRGHGVGEGARGGIVVRDLSCVVSNYRSTKTLDQYCKEQGVVGADTLSACAPVCGLSV